MFAETTGDEKNGKFPVKKNREMLIDKWIGIKTGYIKEKVVIKTDDDFKILLEIIICNLEIISIN